MAKKRPTFDIGKLPVETRRAVLKKNPHLKPEDVGILSDERIAKKKSSRAGRKVWVGPIAFDSVTEAKWFERLEQDAPCVIAHGKVLLTRGGSAEQDPELRGGAYMEPDFIIVEEVFPDGSFRGRLADAKGKWKGKQGAHLERDWKAKAKWLMDKFGLSIRILAQ